MDTFFQRVYVGEIKSQCQFALNAIGSLNSALQQLGSGYTPDPARRMFFHAEVFRQIHSFLTHASNISRLFWPPAPEKKQSESADDYQVRIGQIDKIQRGVSLRELYTIDEHHCLQSRKLRDHLEHYDERLDHWRKTSTNRNIASDTIGPRNAIVGLADTDMMRWFDPSTNSFRFRGEEYDLQDLAAAVERLLPQSIQLEVVLWEHQIGQA